MPNAAPWAPRYSGSGCPQGTRRAFCGQILGDLGAEVLKGWSGPPGLDETRAFGPPFSRGPSAYYLSLQPQQERCDPFDLAMPEGLDIFYTPGGEI